LAEANEGGDASTLLSSSTSESLSGERVRIHRERFAAGTLTRSKLRKEESWIREASKITLSQIQVGSPESDHLTGQISIVHYTEWLIFIDDRRVLQTNNLRTSVTSFGGSFALKNPRFGHRSEKRGADYDGRN